MNKRRRSLLYHLNGQKDQAQIIQDELQVLTLRSSRRGSIFSFIDDELEGTQEPTYSFRFFPLKGPQESILALAKEEGNVILEDVASCKRLGAFRAHSNAIFDLDWSSDGSMIATGSGDQTLSLWDIKSLQSLHSLKGGHGRSVKTLSFAPGSNHLLASGSRDNSIILWDIRAQSPITNHIKNAHLSKEHRSCSVTSIKFLLTDHLLSSVGEMDGCIKVWDLRKNYSLYKRDPLPCFSLPHPGGSSSLGFTSLTIDSSNTIFVSCMDDKIYRYNLGSNNDAPVNVYSGYKNDSFFVRIALSPDENYLTSGSSDAFSYIWRINGEAMRETTPLCKLQGHSSEVTCVEWCKGGWTLVSCSDDLDHCVWRPDRKDDQGSEDVFGFTIPIEAPPPTPLTPPSCRSLIPTSIQTPPLHFTPSSLRKRSVNDRTPGGSTSKKRKLTPSILNFFSKSGTKRGSDDSGAFTPPSKRSNIENVSPKKDKDFLSITGTSQEREPLSSHTSTNRNINKLFDEVAKEASESTTPLKFDKYPCSPTKMRILSNKDLESPKRLQISPLKSFSPTANLPNYVVDRRTPSSSSKKRDRPIDWLTSLSNKKKSKAAKKL